MVHILTTAIDMTDGCGERYSDIVMTIQLVLPVSNIFQFRVFWR